MVLSDRTKAVAILVLVLLAAFLTTSGPPTGDAYLFAARATLDAPVLNHHAGHAAVLWATYHAIPGSWRESVRPAGFVSMLCGIAAGLLLHIFATACGLQPRQAFTAALLYGTTPAAIYWSVVGEQYSLQLLLNLLFAILFIRRSHVGAVLSLVAAALVSPIAVFGSAIVFLHPAAVSRLRSLGAVALAAGVLYLAVVRALGIDLGRGMGGIVSMGGDPAVSAVVGLARLGVVVAVSLGVALASAGIAIRRRGQEVARTWPVLLAVAPFLALAAINPVFTMQLGSFLLPLLAALAIWLARWTLPARALGLQVALSCAIAMGTLILPGNAVTREYRAAGEAVAALEPPPPEICGVWDAAMPVAVLVHGWQVLPAHTAYQDTTQCQGALESGGVRVDGDLGSLPGRVLRYWGLDEPSLPPPHPDMPLVFRGSYLAVRAGPRPPFPVDRSPLP